jgi:hypothetical protein
LSRSPFSFIGYPLIVVLFLYFFLHIWYNKRRKSERTQSAQEAQKGRATMNEKAAEARRAYKRKWARENPEKVKAQQERYWVKQAAKAAERATTPPADGLPERA